MKHRDRVLATLNHEAADRCPMQISFTPEFASRLRQELRRTEGSGHNPHGGGNTYELERALDEDMLLTSVGWANCYYQESGNYIDEWGIGWKQCEYTTRYGKGSYTEIATHPLAEDAALESYHPPDPTRPELYQDAERTLREFRDEYWIVGVTVTTIFECAWALRGIERIPPPAEQVDHLSHRRSPRQRPRCRYCEQSHDPRSARLSRSRTGMTTTAAQTWVPHPRRVSVFAPRVGKHNPPHGAGPA